MSLNVCLSIAQPYKESNDWQFNIHIKTTETGMERYAALKQNSMSEQALKGCCYSIYNFDDVTIHMNGVDVFGYLGTWGKQVR